MKVTARRRHATDGQGVHINFTIAKPLYETTFKVARKRGLAASALLTVALYEWLQRNEAALLLAEEQSCLK